MLNSITSAPGRKTIALLLLSLVIAFVIYLPGLDGPFLHDDYANTVHYKLTTLDWQRLLSLAFGNESGLLRRPFANASFALNFYYGGDSAWSFKLVNLLTHLLTGIVLYLFSRKLLQHTPGLKLDYAQARLVAIITTAIWLLHPLHVSTVLYIVQRMAQFSMLFTLLALYSYLLGRERLIQNRPFAYAFMLGGYAVFGLLGLTSKENAVLLPAYLLLIELLIFRFRSPLSTSTTRDYKFLAVFGLISVIPLLLGLTVFALNSDHFLANYLNRPFSLSERLLTESHVLWSYVQQYFLPRLSELALYHDDYPLQTSLDAATLIAIGGWLAAVAAGIFLHKKEPIVALGIFWFLIAHSLESSIFALEIMYEHRNYMAMYGLLIAAVYLVFRISSTTRLSVYINVFIFAFILLLAYQTYSRAQVWSDKETLIRFESKFHPDSFRLVTEQINFDFEAKDYAAAHEKTKRLRQIHPWDPGVPLLDIIIDCEAGKDSTQYLAESIASINKSPLTGTMLGAVQKITNAFLDDLCPTVTAEEVGRIINAALAHPWVVRKPRLAQMLYVLHGRVNYKAGDNPSAKQLLMKAHQARPGELGPLLEKSYIELNEGDLVAANATLALLKSLNEQPGVLRYFTHRIVELEGYIQQELLSRKKEKLPGT